MRVLHLVKTTRGAHWAVRLVRELVELGVDVHIALPDKAGHANLCEAAGATVHVLDCNLQPTRFWRLPGQLLALRTLVKTLKPEVVHSHFVGTTLVMRLALKGLSVWRIFQVPGPLHLEHRFYRWLELVFANQHDHWIATCEWTRDAYIRFGIPAERVHLSYYGTDPLKRKQGNPEILRRLLNIEPDVPLIGMVAYMYAPKRYLGQKRGLKGHEDLIDAMALVIRKHPSARVAFIGSAWASAKAYEQQIHEYAATKLGDHALFIGSRQDVADLYPGFTMAVHPSHSENVGGAAESLSLGIPTITTQVGGFPDLVKQGETGLLVPPKDPEALAEAICYYIEHPDVAVHHAQAGRELGTHLFDIKRTALEVFKIYHLMNTHSGEMQRIKRTTVSLTG